MCDIPVDIAQEEKIVRAVFSHHLEKNKKTLRKNLFDDPADQASVMRLSHMGADACKKRALEITPGDPNIRYRGMAVVTAKVIREHGAEVIDSRIVYCGHAHVSVDIEMPPVEEPLYSARKLQRDERLRALKKSAHYVADPAPDSEQWTGEIL